MNPAMTLSFAVFRGFSWRQVPWYVLSQFLGAFLAAAILYSLFSGGPGQFEAAHGIVRGTAGSELSAMVYGEYFPNPCRRRRDCTGRAGWSVSCRRCWPRELARPSWRSLCSRSRMRRTCSGPGRRLFPVFIGLTVSIVISVVAPLTQAGLNPARDFGPRLFAYLAGWGPIAIPGPRGGFSHRLYSCRRFSGLSRGRRCTKCLLPGPGPRRSRPWRRRHPSPAWENLYHDDHKTPVRRRIPRRRQDHAAVAGGRTARQTRQARRPDHQRPGPRPGGHEAARREGARAFARSPAVASAAISEG